MDGNSKLTTAGKIKPLLGFDSFETAEKTIRGIEIMHMIKNWNKFLH